MYNFNFNESDMLSKSQNENILDDLEIAEDKEDFNYEDFVQQAIASGDIDTLILINEIEVEDEEDDSLDNQEVVEDDESFSIVEKDGQNWKVLSTAKGKYNAARKYNECITKAKNEVRLVSLKDLEKMNESRKNEAPANSESLFTALMSELNTIYKCEITDEGFLRCTDDGGNFIEVATVKNTDPVELGMRVNFTDGTQSETVYYVYDNIQAVNDFIQAVFISEVNAFNDMNDVEAEEVQKEEKEDVEIEDENQAQEEIDKNVEEVEEKTESLINESKVTPEQIKVEVEEKLKDVYKDYPEFYEEYVYVDTYYRDEDGRLVIEVRAELGYDDMISLSEEIDPIVKKYDKYAYFDMADSGILEAVLDFDEKHESLNESDDKFNYMMLDRLRTDCEYFLGNGNGYEKHLWAGNVEDQIAEMRKIYDKLTEKPDWISLEDIDKYEKEMLAKRDSKNEVKEITRDEWDKTPKDYKMIKDGKPYLVYLDDETHATVLGPCKIIDESLNEKYCTKAEITRFLKSHKATEVAFGRYVSEIRGTEKLFEMHASGSKKIAGTYDSFDLIVYPKGALYREELATGFGKITTKYYIFGVEAEKIDESLNEDGTVSDMGVAPIMPASYDDIDDIDDELFDITEGFLFPDPEEESDEDKEEEVNSLMGAAIEDINQGQPTASEWIEDAQYVFNSIKDDTVKNRLRSKYSQYLESKKNEASAELNKVIKDLAANDKTDVDKEINKLYKEEPEAKSNVADGSPILGATSPDNIVPTIDKAIMNKAIFAATSYANNGPQMFAKLQESFKNIDRKTLDDLMNSEDVAGIAKYLYESEMRDNKVDESDNTYQVLVGVVGGDDMEVVAIEDTEEDAIERAKYEYTHSDLDEDTLVEVLWVENGETIFYISSDCEEKLYESLNEDTFTDPQMNVVNSDSTTVATGNSPETPKLADDIDPAPTEVQGFPKDKSEIENTNANNKEDQLAKDSGTEDVPTDN